MQARWFGHSLLLTHSGLQFGGEPTYVGKQEHDGESPTTLHSAFGPHGDGLQGSTIGSSPTNVLVYMKFSLIILIAIFFPPY